MVRYLLLFACALLAACSDEDPTRVVSTGLKIFVTPELHSYDFQGDPTLTGSTGIQKADDFCNRSAGKPNESTYKALLIDGTHRETATNWVLQPNTTYYQVYNDTPIATTTDAAIFAAFYTQMANPICGANWCDVYAVWTGIGDAADFSPSGNDCGDWGSGGNGSGPNCGVPTEVGGNAFSNCYAPCTPGSTQQLRVYCVEQ